MAEMTKEFAQRVAEAGRRGEHSPLTPWEESQLAYGWLQWHAHLTQPAQAVDVARRFHEAYERLAPSFGYETRPETRVFDPESPNGKLMTAVCAEVARALSAEKAGCVGGVDAQAVELCIFAVLGSRWEEGGSLQWTASDAESLRSDMRAALRSSRALAVTLPEALPDDPDENLTGKGYIRGWNECRLEMLPASTTPGKEG